MTAEKVFKGRMKKGETRNPAGRPKGSGGPRSKLRNILSKFEDMCKVQAPNIIQQSLDGEDVDKEKLATAKWVVSTYKTIHQACIQEEQMKRSGKQESDDTEEVDDSGKGVVFQLHMNNANGETKEVTL